MSTSIEELFLLHLRIFGGGGASYVGTMPLSGPIAGNPIGTSSAPQRPLTLTIEAGQEIVLGEDIHVYLPPLQATPDQIVTAEEIAFTLSPRPVQGDVAWYPTAIAEDEQWGILLLKANGITYGIRTTVGTLGNDYFHGSGVVMSGSGNDTIVGDWQSDMLLGGTGSDVLNGREGADILDGGEGLDFANYWNSGAGVFVSLAAPQGNTGEAAGDVFVSIEGLEGSQFGDTLVGDGQANVLRGVTGDDVLNGREGADTLDGGTGYDLADYFNAASGVVASLADASLNTGEAAGDTYVSIEGLNGSWHGDTLTGNDGDNRLNGLGGNDVLFGGKGNDVLWGGSGQDVFCFATTLNAGSNVDTIMDFNVADDTIWLNRWIFNTGGSGALAASAFAIGAQASTAQQRIVYNQSTGDLFYDADGSGAAAQVKFAHIGAGLALSATDFWMMGY